MDRIDLKKIAEEVVGLEDITVSQDIDIVDDHDEEWIEDRSKPEVEFDDEQQQSYEQELTNLRVLEWLNEMTSDPKASNLDLISGMRSTGTSMNIFVRGVGVGLTHTENLLIKKVKNSKRDRIFRSGNRRGP